MRAAAAPPMKMVMMVMDDGASESSARATTHLPSLPCCWSVPFHSACCSCFVVWPIQSSIHQMHESTLDFDPTFP